MTDLNGATVQSLFLRMRVREEQLGVATGFVISVDYSTSYRRHFLVTNWHVLAGRNPITGAPMHPSAATPDTVRIHHNSAKGLKYWVERDQPLYDDNDDPLWLEHPIFGRKVDVACLPLTQLEDVAIYHHDPEHGADVVVEVTSDVSVVGYPFGLRHAGGLAIWTRGTVATEFEWEFDDLPCFLIDARTREGQSGSPVLFWNSDGTARYANGAYTAGVGRPVARFLGIYSGRINAESDLGRVWRPSVIKEVVLSGRPPEL